MSGEGIFDLVLNDSLTWEYLVLDIVKEEGINPWDVDVSVLTSKYIHKIKDIEDLDFRLSGKVVLVAAILLRLKSSNFVFVEKEEKAQKPVGLLDEIEITESDLEHNIPLPKKRKVTLEELMSALEKALVVEDRKKKRVEKRKELEVKREFEVNFKSFNLTEKVGSLFEGIKGFVKKKGFVLFKTLIKNKETDKQEIIWTFLPLMHLANKHEVLLEQERPFKDDIKIKLP